MCGRFTTTFEFSDIRVRWNLDRDLPKYTPRFNVGPETSHNIPVIVRHKASNESRLMHRYLHESASTKPNSPYMLAEPARPDSPQSSETKANES